jgi:hypothetical protein
LNINLSEEETTMGLQETVLDYYGLKIKQWWHTKMLQEIKVYSRMLRKVHQLVVMAACHHCKAEDTVLVNHQLVVLPPSLQLQSAAHTMNNVEITTMQHISVITPIKLYV